MIQLKQEEELIKSRGYRATIKAAYNLFTDNYKVILKHIWPYALALAVILGFFILNQFKTYGQVPSLTDMLVSGALMLFTIVAEIVFYGRTMMLFNGQSFTWNILRALKATLWMILLVVVFTLIIIGISAAFGSFSTGTADSATGIPQTDPMIQMQQQQTIFAKNMMIAMLAMTILSLLLLPIVYVYIKYFVETDTHFHKILFKNLKTGMKHWGYIFLTLLVVSICISVIGLIISLPLIILFTAYGFSIQGVMQGDEAGIPGYFTPLAYGVSLVSYFIYAIMILFSLFVAYYIYGSIEAKEQEKRNLKLNTEY